MNRLIKSKTPNARHAIRRCWERYNIRLTTKDIKRINRMLHCGLYHNVVEEPSGFENIYSAIVVYRRRSFRVLFDMTTEKVKTFIPYNVVKPDGTKQWTFGSKIKGNKLKNYLT